ncbi:uncharacterized protein LOC111073727 [Drosophila obscura]|uniref:uncharacterized protein LOC111073727 n=1 Tax=Drosophila obscura TaxID=7282 RepID=UPI000BA08857|nr:uncharacterized protein LOC111073727 [Drosophila obscura]XP_022221889.1 uncharacterized protein LOC111073727 [Drosophila obscura]
MRHTLRLILLWLVILLPSLCLTQPSCQTPEKSPGQCVHFSACRFVLREYAMYKEHMPPTVMRFLQRSRCRPKRDGYHLCCELKDVIPANANSKLK